MSATSPSDNDFDSDSSLDSMVRGVRLGEPDALDRVFKTYFQNLVAYAKRRVHFHNGGVDCEVVAASAMCTFVKGAVAGKYDRLADQGELYRLLCVIVLRKAIRYRKRNRRYVQLVDKPNADGSACREDGNWVDSFFPAGAVAEEAAIVHETLEQLLVSLNNPTLNRIVVMQLEGHSTPYIADQLGLSMRSVQRFIKKIRHTLKQIEKKNTE